MCNFLLVANAYSSTIYLAILIFAIYLIKLNILSINTPHKNEETQLVCKRNTNSALGLMRYKNKHMETWIIKR